MLAHSLIYLSRSQRARRLVTGIPISRRVVNRFVAGDTANDAIDAVRRLRSAGFAATVDRLGEDTTDVRQAEATRDAYVALLVNLGAFGLASAAEVSLKLSALGRALPADGHQHALANVHAICEAASRVGTTVTIDMEDHTTVDATLTIVGSLRAEFPWVGAVLQACLRRTEADCRDLSYAASRVRLVKGAYAEPASVAYPAKSDVDAAYDRCMGILMAGEGYPMVATHDQARIDRAVELAREHGRSADRFEVQMLFGIRAAEQRRLADRGTRVRVYVPYGSDWYPYFMRRLAERPANLAFFLKALVARS